MLDEFLEVAYVTQTKKQAQFELTGLLKALPDMELRKLAAGTPVAELYGHLDKRAYSDCASPDGEPKTFLDRFKGTPLFDQAVALEQQELQAEMADMQKRQDNRAQRQTEDSLYDQKDRIRVQKRLLELELAKQEGGAPSMDPATPGGAPPPAAPPGAGPPAPAPLPGAPGPAAEGKVAFAVTEKGHKFDAEQARMQARQGAEHLGLTQAYAPGFGQGPANAPGRMEMMRFAPSYAAQLMEPRHQEYIARQHEAGSNAWNPFGGILTPSSHESGETKGTLTYGDLKAPKEHKREKEARAKLAFADGLGRTLARNDAARAGHAGDLRKIAEAAGIALAKSAAMGVPSLGGMGQLAGKALGWAAKNPGAAGSMVGAGLGAGAGAVAGGPNHRLSGAAGGAMGGAALGGAAAGVGGRMAAGQALGTAATNTARSAMNTGMRGVNAVAGKLPGQLGGQVSGAVQGANQAGHDALSRMGGLKPAM